jgi:hypothetical protein
LERAHHGLQEARRQRSHDFTGTEYPNRPQGQNTHLQEQVYTAQRDETVRIAAENETLRRVHDEVDDAILMPLYKLRCTVGLTE